MHMYWEFVERKQTRLHGIRAKKSQHLSLYCRQLRYPHLGDQIFNCVISDISVVQRETTLTISDSIVKGLPVESKILRVVSLSTIEIKEITRLKLKKTTHTHTFSGFWYLKFMSVWSTLGGLNGTGNWRSEKLLYAWKIRNSIWSIESSTCHFDWLKTDRLNSSGEVFEFKVRNNRIHQIFLSEFSVLSYSQELFEIEM